VLSTGQHLLADRFARPHKDKFEGVSHAVGAYGVPLIDGAVAHFECRIVDRYYGGDHEIFLGHVERYSYERKPTLLFCHGAYHRGEPLEA
jgi:flavin reductase (DIM6/NTAB) family NADH-FMN oxidoreductase RutF